MTDNLYTQHWDFYAANVRRKGDWWPGDEWGTPESWDRTFTKLFVDHGVAGWRKCVEIGAGSGKYTTKVLDRSAAHVLAADVSPNYQKVFCERMTEAGLMARVSPVLLDNESSTLRQAIEGKGWRGALDGFYSMDAMVHVDLQFSIAYLVTAGISLRPGGKLIMTFANCCSDLGFKKLIADTKNSFRRMGKHSGRFEWLSPDAVASILPRLGFEIDVLQTTGRDIGLVATLQEPLTDPEIIKCVDPAP